MRPIKRRYELGSDKGAPDVLVSLKFCSRGSLRGLLAKVPESAKMSKAYFL
jgi:hypothetical protein